MEGVRHSRRPGRRAYLMVAGFAALLVLFPFLFWYQTWFGRRLSSQDLDAYLNDASRPRHQQHALVQLGEHIGRGEHSARRWYPNVVQLSGSPVMEVRQTAAWIMGQDHTYPPFHDALRKLLKDPSAMVRRNAALALSNFHDAEARPELLAMLRPYVVISPAAGVIRYRLKLGEFVNPGTLVGRVGPVEIRSPLPGEVLELSSREGDSLRAGDPVVEVAADKDHAWEALRALWSIGEKGDLDDIRRYARGVPGMPEKVQQQALLTAQAIESRTR